MEQHFCLRLIGVVFFALADGIRAQPPQSLNALTRDNDFDPAPVPDLAIAIVFFFSPPQGATLRVPRSIPNVVEHLI